MYQCVWKINRLKVEMMLADKLRQLKFEVGGRDVERMESRACVGG